LKGPVPTNFGPFRFQRRYVLSTFASLFSKPALGALPKIKVKFGSGSKKECKMRKALTLEQIANLAGVSRTTASRVINGLPGVRSATRERVLKVVQEYGYQPDPTAQSLAAHRSKKRT
jgi:hypothetical protein